MILKKVGILFILPWLVFDALGADVVVEIGTRAHVREANSRDRVLSSLGVLPPGTRVQVSLPEFDHAQKHPFLKSGMIQETGFVPKIKILSAPNLSETLKALKALYILFFLIKLKTLEAI